MRRLNWFRALRPTAPGWAPDSQPALALGRGPRAAAPFPPAQGPSQSALEQVFRVLFEQGTEGVLLCHEDGTVLACNAAAAAVLRTEPARVTGSALSSWLTPLGRPGTVIPATAMGFPPSPGEACALRADGSTCVVDLQVHATPAGGDVRCVVRLQDLTERRQTQQRLEYLSNFDALTGLPNRTLFRDRLQQAMERARRTGAPMALMFLDLDRFKTVNDSLGHGQGDLLLRQVAQAMARSLRTVDTVSRTHSPAAAAGADHYTLSRLGGDEFTVIAEGVGGPEDAAMIARRLLEAVSVPTQIGEQTIHLTASIGISLFPTDGVDVDGIIRHTDMAMYRSKQLGRATYSFFSEDLNVAVNARMALESGLRQAIEQEEFCLHFQPKQSLSTGAITGVEALLRWHCPGRGMVPPDRFIGVLEETGLIVPVGAWVIRAACAQLAAWDAEGLPAIGMAVNLSSRQLRDPELVNCVAQALEQHHLAPHRLELELTESMLMEDLASVREVLSAIDRLGVRLAIDDFGTGYSSLSYLRRLRVDTLKIDRSFVTEIQRDPEDRAIAAAVVSLGRSLRMNVVAEGVETEAQADFLRQLGCAEMQGWLLSRALPPEELLAFVLGHAPGCLAPQAPGARTQPAELIG